MAKLGTRCNRGDCFANKCGVACVILDESYPDNQECPFFKTMEQYQKDRKDSHALLEEKGRYDLIAEYEYGPKARNSIV